MNLPGKSFPAVRDIAYMGVINVVAEASMLGFYNDQLASQRFALMVLAERVTLVPGAYFDVNPGKARKGASPFRVWVRFSFGPPEENLRQGLARLTALVGRHRSTSS
jgi:DNA-binding transcriptional MocR family regulator